MNIISMLKGIEGTIKRYAMVGATQKQAEELAARVERARKQAEKEEGLTWREKGVQARREQAAALRQGREKGTRP